MTLGHEDHKADHAHSHGAVDPAIYGTQRGIWAVTWSFWGLMITAVLQFFIFAFTGSVALLADTIHNFGDSATSIPLWVAFRLSRRKPTSRFTYGYGRVEDLAGVTIIAIVFFSGIGAGFESVKNLLHPRTVEHIGAVALGGILGFIGNEAVARFRLKVGREIGSAALVADGYHARTDGLTSLAVLLGAVGTTLGYPVADPVIGLFISAAILRVMWGAARSVFSRLLDGVDVEVVGEIRKAAYSIAEIRNVGEVRVRWLGHRMHAEVNAAVTPDLTVEEGHRVAQKVRHEILHQLRYLSNVIVHIDPVGASGEEFHRIEEHTHDTFPSHSHE